MSPDPLQELLDRQGFVMLDGGLATELEARGADLDHHLWSARVLMESPELIRQVHDDFLTAGADIIATATYQASTDGFTRTGVTPREAHRLMRMSIELAREARTEFWSNPAHRAGRLRPLVAASLGPYGACLHDGSEYHGRYGLGKRALIDFHRPRLELLANDEIDLLAFETIPSRLEAEALIELLEDFRSSPAWISFSCRDQALVCHGETFAECAALAERAKQIVAIGINCTAPRHLTALLRSARSVKKPLMAYPNSGETWLASGNRWVGKPGDGMDPVAWYDAGARVFGGCCRTGPEDIRRMRSLVAARAGQRP